jgi:hypothetical protein
MMFFSRHIPCFHHKSCPNTRRLAKGSQMREIVVEDRALLNTSGHLHMNGNMLRPRHTSGHGPVGQRHKSTPGRDTVVSPLCLPPPPPAAALIVKRLIHVRGNHTPCLWLDPRDDHFHPNLRLDRLGTLSLLWGSPCVMPWPSPTCRRLVPLNTVGGWVTNKIEASYN